MGDTLTRPQPGTQCPATQRGSRSSSRAKAGENPPFLHHITTSPSTPSSHPLSRSCLQIPQGPSPHPEGGRARPPLGTCPPPFPPLPALPLLPPEQSLVPRTHPSPPGVLRPSPSHTATFRSPPPPADLCFPHSTVPLPPQE